MLSQTLRLPGDLCYSFPQPRNSHPSDMVCAMRKFANSCQPIGTRAISFKPVHLPRVLQTCTHVFIRNDPIKANLTPTFFLFFPEPNTVFPFFVVTNFTQLLLTTSNQHLLRLLWNISSQFSPFVKMILLQILHAHTILDTLIMYPYVFEMTMLCISVMLLCYWYS